MFVRAAEINDIISNYLSLDVATQKCIASQRYFVRSGNNNNEEKTDKETFVYSYQKDGEGYNIYCKSFDIEDNIIYLAGKRAEISDKDTVETFEELFLNHDSSKDLPKVATQMLVYDPTEIAEAVQKYRFTNIEKYVDGNTINYKLFLTSGFYRYVLRNAYRQYETRDIKKSVFEPLILTVENGILKSIKFDVDGYFYTRNYLGVEYKIDRKYFCEIYYSDDFAQKTLDENADIAFYRSFTPSEVAHFNNVNDAAAEFYKGKLFFVENSNYSDKGGLTLKIFDLKNKEILTEKKLSDNPYESVSSLSIKDGYAYVRNSYGTVYEYEIENDKLSFIDGCFICSMTEDGIVVNIDNEYYCGKNFDSLLKQDEVKFHSYHGEANRYYSITHENGKINSITHVENGKINIALTDKNGNVIKDISVDRYIFNSVGIVVAYIDDSSKELIELQLDYDLNELEYIERDNYLERNVVAPYLDKTDRFTIYNHYIKDNINSERYYLAPSYTQNIYVFNGVVYFFSDGVLFSSENYTTVKSEERLFSWY